MKKLSKKDQAKIDFVDWMAMHPTCLSSFKFKRLLKVAKDEELSKLVEQYVNSYLDLEKKVSELKQEFAAHLLPE